MSNENITMEDVNKSLYATMKINLTFPINEIVAWAIFGDSTFLEPTNFLYSNYSESCEHSLLINKAHIELMNSIERDVKDCIAENSHKVDFTTIDSANRGIENILDTFLPKKYAELTPLIIRKSNPFKAPIWWAALVIAYREMALFAFNNDSFYVAMQLNEFCRECQAQMVFKNVAFVDTYKKKLSKAHKKNGSKGGSQKGVNYSKPKQKALDYHDKYLSGINEKGKFIYSSDKASIKIIEHFAKRKEDLGYAPRSLSNVIRQHRDEQNKK